jgi:hypothetical protein
MAAYTSCIRMIPVLAHLDGFALPGLLRRINQPERQDEVIILAASLTPDEYSYLASKWDIKETFTAFTLIPSDPKVIEFLSPETSQPWRNFRALSECIHAIHAMSVSLKPKDIRIALRRDAFRDLIMTWEDTSQIEIEQSPDQPFVIVLNRHRITFIDSEMTGHIKGRLEGVETRQQCYWHEDDSIVKERGWR